MKVVQVFVVLALSFALCSASDELEELRKQVRALQKENENQAGIIQMYERAAHRRLATKSKFNKVGVKVKNDKGMIALGEELDVVLARTGDHEATLFSSLSIDGDATVEKVLNVEGQLNARNGVRVGPNTGTCDKSRAGMIRYNEKKDTLEFCSGTTDAWVQFAQKKPKADGKSPLTAGNSCRSIKAVHKSSGDGQYWVKPDRYNGSPFQVYCDMTSSPGGWTLVSQGFGGPLPTQNWRSNNGYNEKSCAKKQDYTTKNGVICKLEASKINALVSNDKTGRYKAFVPYPIQQKSARTSYSLGTCVYDYTKALPTSDKTNMHNSPCTWQSDKFDMSNPKMQGHSNTQGVIHYRYKGKSGAGFVWHYGSDKVRWWMVDNRHHGDIRTKNLNFIMWVY